MEEMHKRLENSNEQAAWQDPLNSSVQAMEFKNLPAVCGSVGPDSLSDMGLSCKYLTAWKFLSSQTTQPTVREPLK